MQIKLFRMQNGEEVVAELVGETDDTYDISNPIVMVPGRDGTIGFAPWAPLLAEDVKVLTIRASYVVYVSVPNAQVVENYEQIFSPIIKPTSAGKIIT
jgi:hypothetical protein